MFKEIKYYLSKMTLPRKTGLILLSFLVLFGLFLIPRPANADFFGIADSFWGLLQSQLSALKPIKSVVWQLIIFLMLLLVESQAFLYFTAKLFQWAIDFPIHLGITPANPNPLVASGWAFTSGLVNILFILIFVVIALAYILRIETLGAKKALPRLIIVALLLNFSLVFIGMAVDITQLTLNSIINSLGSNLPSLAIAPLASSLQNLTLGYLTLLGGYILVSLVPFLNVAGAYALIVAIISEAFFGTFSLTILLIILGFGLGIIFLFYFVLFMIRVSMIWMLAILSPLAFTAWIFPSTQKYWKQWLQLLLDWLFFGIIVVLLGGLGLKLFAENTVVPGTGPIPVGPFGLFPSFTYNYLFLLIYLGIMIYYSKKKFAPELATVLIDQATGLAKRGAPMTKVAKKGLGKWWKGQLRKKVKGEELGELLKREAIVPTPEWTGRLGRVAQPAATAFWALRRGVGKALGPGVIETGRKEIDEAEKEVEKQAVEMVISKFRSATEWTRKIGFIDRLVKKDDIDEALDKGLKPSEVAQTLIEAKKYGREKEIVSAMPYLERPRMGAIAVARGISLEKAYREEIISKIKPARSKNVSRRVYARAPGTHPSGTREFEHPEILEAIVRSWEGRHMGKFIELHGREGADAIEDRIEQLAHDDTSVSDAKAWLEKYNKRLLKYIRSSAGQGWGFTI